MIKNLLKETVGVLERHKLTVNDVRWVGSIDGTMALSWREFGNIANLDYDAGFGGQHIARDLVVVGEDWWLERHEYDGSEWWEYKRLPQRAANAEPFSKIQIDYGECLRELHQGQDE